ncbi:MAG: hypothetical protein JXA96_12190 [Sedimentisphaerales bacterium]|nr:hypothetical protein [Sedimentisphaerales bacterium]
MKNTVKNKFEIKYRIGSALILAVVLSTLLAIVGVLFLMAANINQMGTAAISENKELEFAVDTVIADISQKLALDVPGLVNQSEEYYDYPDSNNPWLASLEPYESGGNYYWRQISDTSGQLFGKNRNIKIEVVSQYGPISDSNYPLADADGDAVADSRWIRLEGISSSHSKPIYAAIRIIDNSAMLNVNTGFKCDPCAPNVEQDDIDGRNQTQINVMALAGWAGDPSKPIDEEKLLLERANNGVGVDEPYDLLSYLKYYIWYYNEPNGPYTPFDMADELEMRYRFLLNNTDIDTRLESWGNQFRDDTLSTPLESNGELDNWFLKAYNTFQNNIIDPNSSYSYRHIATVNNMDRILNPAGLELNNGKMVNINTASPQLLYETIKMSLQGREPNALHIEQLAAQLAVNIIDLRDKDADVTALTIDTKTYYGFEAQPFISEIGFKISDTEPNNSDKNSFAVELYNPFNVDIPLSSFKVELYDTNDNVVDPVSMSNFIIKAQGRFVITNNSTATSEFDIDDLKSGELREDPNLVLAEYVSVGGDPPTYQLSKRYNLRLVRTLPASNLLLDKQTTQDEWFKWDDANDSSKFYSRSDSYWNIVYQEFASSLTNTLGVPNLTAVGRKNYNLANSNDFYITIGDIARTLTIGPSTDANDMIGVKLASEPNEYDIRLNLKNPVYSNLFQFLTVIDPTEYRFDPNETRVKGRININTAAWFVLAQLPWMPPDVAQAIASFRDIVNSRDSLNRPFGAFDTIGDLMQVPQMDYYAIDDYNNVDLKAWPDLTYNDGAISDFEERDLIFSRISNLATVRSDIFTAYILVRIGLDGPQKRVIAILDRSEVESPTDKVKLLALQPVPDPR